MLHTFRTWLRSLSPTEQALAENLLVWTIAIALLWYVSHGLTARQVGRALSHSDLALFVAANVVSFVIRWLTDTYLYSRLFSFFHSPTRYTEVLPASTAQYFLQAVNLLVADGAMVVFLHQRKGVDWVTAGWTMAFQGFIDAILMSGLTVLMGLLIPGSPIHLALPYAACAFVFLVAVAVWWMWGHSASQLGGWLRGRRGMHAFRSARPYHYLVLGLIRLGIYASNALSFYLYLAAFRLSVPLSAVLALSPAVMFAQSAPITPSGLGPLQAVVVDGFLKYAHRDNLLTAALGVGILQLLCRLPLGVGAAGTFARRVLTSERGPELAVAPAHPRKSMS